jgi:predicted nucleic acid-binding protein
VNYILDTNVISELVAVQPNRNVIHWIEGADPDQVFISVIVVGELKKGIDKLTNSKRKEMLDQWLRDDLLVRFQDHLLPIDVDTMLMWGSLNARLEAMGRPISAIDALLAATVLQYRYTLVTRNTSHFGNTGILLFNPWDD